VTTVLRVPPTHAVTNADRPRRHRATPSDDRGTPRPPLEAILRNLPAAHREILAATYFRRQTTREAARQLGITPDDAKRRLYLATRELAAVVGTARHQCV
jgi:DNA-directed RNA polymerase specialized sigma24 family protein